MKNHRKYLMEDDQEAVRLDVKTDPAAVEKQALWAGIKPGMRVADLGCGAGKTTFHLNRLVQPEGRAVGLDIADQRIEYAKTHYSDESIEYVVADIRDSLEDFGQFDFIWVRFVLEYYLNGSFDYDLGFLDIDVDLSAHNMFFGELKENEKFNSMQKAQIAGRNSGYPFEEYDGNIDGFLEEVKIFFDDSRVFYYTPLIACRGRKP